MRVCGVLLIKKNKQINQQQQQQQFNYNIILFSTRQELLAAASRPRRCSSGRVGPPAGTRWPRWRCGPGGPTPRTSAGTPQCGFSGAWAWKPICLRRVRPAARPSAAAAASVAARRTTCSSARRRNPTAARAGRANGSVQSLIIINNSLHDCDRARWWRVTTIIYWFVPALVYLVVNKSHGNIYTERACA